MAQSNAWSIHILIHLLLGHYPRFSGHVNPPTFLSKILSIAHFPCMMESKNFFRDQRGVLLCRCQIPKREQMPHGMQKTRNDTKFWALICTLAKKLSSRLWPQLPGKVSANTSARQFENVKSGKWRNRAPKADFPLSTASIHGPANRSPGPFFFFHAWFSSKGRTSPFVFVTSRGTKRPVSRWSSPAAWEIRRERNPLPSFFRACLISFFPNL